MIIGDKREGLKGAEETLYLNMIARGESGTRCLRGERGLNRISRDCQRITVLKKSERQSIVKLPHPWEEGSGSKKEQRIHQ